MNKKKKPSFFKRFFLSFAVCWRFVFNADFAAAVLRVRQEGKPVKGEETVAVTQLQEALPDSALQMLGLLQQEGRFIDFIEENIAGYSDAEIGAAVRVVHEGCRKALRQHFVTEPVRAESEGSRITLEEGFDASAVRLTGNVVGQPPFSGTLAHRGWRVTEVKLPKIAAGHDVNIVAPAEVEL